MRVFLTFLFIIINLQDVQGSDILSDASFIGQADTPWKVNARTLSYRKKDGLYEAEGDVVISKGGMTLYAQKVIYSKKTGIAEVQGDFELKTGQDTLEGKDGIFDFNQQVGKITNGKLFLRDNHFYAKGKLIEKKSANTYQIRDCQLTTCDGQSPLWSITGSEVNVTMEGYGTIKHAAFKVRDIPVLYVPYFIFPAKTKRQTGLLMPRFGHSSRTGMDVEIPLFMAISEQTDMTFYQRYMTKRGYMQGLEFRYMSGKESNGNFLFDILNDQENKDMNDADDLSLSPFSRTNDTRYWLRGRADQTLPYDISARMDADFVSDQDYLNELDTGGHGAGSKPDLFKESGRPVEEKRSPIRSSRLRFSRDQENYSLQGMGSFYQLPGNPNRNQTAEPVGSLFYSLLPEKLHISPLPAYFSVMSDYDYVWRDQGQKGHRYSLSPTLRFPFHIKDIIDFEPTVQYSLTPQWFEKNQGGHTNQTLKTFEANVTLSTTLDRVFSTDTLGAKKMKHRMRPLVKYTYRDFDDASQKRPSPWFEPLVDEGDANLLSFGIENFLSARFEDENGDISYRQWATFHLIQNYNIEEKRKHYQPTSDREPFETLDAELTLTPVPNLDVFSQAKWDHHDNEITYVDMSVVLSVDRSGNRKDRFQLDYLYEIDNINIEDHESLNAWCDVNLTYGLSVGSSVEMDMNINENISNAYWLEYMNQCWGIRLVAENDNDDTSIKVEFHLQGLAGFGFD